MQDKTLRGFRHVLRGGLRGKELGPARTRPLRGEDPFSMIIKIITIDYDGERQQQIMIVLCVLPFETKYVRLPVVSSLRCFVA